MATKLQKDSKLYTSAAGSVWNLAPTTSISIERGPEKADNSRHGDSSSRFMKSLERFAGDCELRWDTADAAIIEIIAAVKPSTGTGLLYIKVLEDGAEGASLQCFVSVKVSSRQGPETLVKTMSFEPASGGVPTAYP